MAAAKKQKVVDAQVVESVDIVKKSQVDEEMSEAAEALAEALALEIDSPETLEFVGELINDVRARNKRLEEMKQSALRPMRQSIETIGNWFKPVQNTYTQMEQTLKGKVLAYRNQLEAQREAAVAAMQEAETVEEVQEAQAVLAVSQPASTPTIAMSKVWDYEITNEAEIPRAFLSVNTAAIRTWMRDEANRDAGIPGVRFFQKDIVSSRQR